MISVKIAEFFITTVTFFVAYSIIVTIAGAFRAWITEKMGDDSAVQAGFLSLNPLDHIDIVGLIALFLFRFGWGRHIPINPTYIHARSTVVRWLKLCIAYWSDAFAHVVMATVSMAGLLAIFGVDIVNFADKKGELMARMMLSGNLSHTEFSVLYPEVSSLAISIALVLIASIYLNVFLAVFDFVFRGLELFMMYIFEKAPHYAKYNTFSMMILYAIVVTLFITPQLRVLLVLTISYWGYMLARLFNAI